MPLPEINGIVGPVEGLDWKHKLLAESYTQYVSKQRLGLPNFLLPSEKQNGKQLQSETLFPPTVTPIIEKDNLFNVIHQGDSIEILRQYPDESVDLVFADPPYNLDKNYTIYDDERADHKYIAWCNTWLGEYTRILKPTGSLFVLNLPRWSLYHANFLNRHLHFQNWIVWDALSEPQVPLLSYSAFCRR